MTFALSTEALAEVKRQQILGVGETEWQKWRHSPITASYLQFLEDQVAFYRDSAADILEAGQFAAGSSHQDKNPDVLRGQIVMLRQLHGLELAAIQRFYGKEAPKDEAHD